MKHEPFVIERIYNAPVEKVWKAITDKNDMKQWYFDLSDFKAKPGFEFSFEGGPPERSYVHRCKVIEVIEKKKLSYSWSYDGSVGESTVTFELFAEGNKTRLKLTHAGIETFIPNNNPDFDTKNFIAGWNDIIGKLLKDFVEKEASN